MKRGSPSAVQRRQPPEGVAGAGINERLGSGLGGDSGPKGQLGNYADQCADATEEMDRQEATALLAISCEVLFRLFQGNVFLLGLHSYGCSDFPGYAGPCLPFREQSIPRK